MGPTGVGKTELSIRLAQENQGEIVSADSRLFYCGMDIGTAKPNQKERKRIPHHLIDIVNPDQPIDLPHYQRLVYQVISQIHQRDKLPFLVGGTGQYIWAILEGWMPPARYASNHLREILTHIGEEKGSRHLHRKLTFIDREAAEKINPNNLRRIVRAFEVICISGKIFSELKNKKPPDYLVKIIGLIRPRSSLYHRIDERIEKMIQDGFVGEVEILRKQGFSTQLPSMSAIGYKEISQFLENKISLEEVIIRMKRATRRFIRHQANWFKETDERIKWFNIEEGSYEDKINAFITSENNWLRIENEK